jgi:epoxyqueuosine reductase
MNLSQAIKRKALDLGFDAAGITDASPLQNQQVEHLHRWLEAGFAGQMGYMARNLEKRVNPRQLLDGAESVIVVVLGYKPRAAQALPQTAPIGRVAAYAQCEDYHVVMKKLLRKLADFIESQAHKPPKFKVCVDSAPVAERALAARAGLGFIGKNHMLINPELGPQLFLGEIITDLKLDIDKPLPTNCADCDKCIRACPMGALRDDGFIDANKCISYLTIEHKGDIAPDLAQKIGERLFGCDECVLACPLQKQAPACRNTLLEFYPQRAFVDLRRVMSMNCAEFDAEFADSTIKRAGLDSLKRNAVICLKNIERGQV